MKLTKKFRTAALGAAIALMIVGAALSTHAAYDGVTDPVISLSYLRMYKQQEIDPQIDRLNQQIAALQVQLNQLSAQVGAGPTAPSDSVGMTYEVIGVPVGTKVIAQSPCDIMLRSGSSVAVSPFPSQGLSDYTSGTEILNGQPITVNHMLLIPRGGDGRGILITSANAFVMIRGEYTLES